MVVKKQKTAGCYMLIFFHLLLGIGALAGGGVLIISPDGSMSSMPLEILRNTPFNNFLIPGIILFTCLGVLPVVTAIFLASEKSLRVSGKLSLYKEAHGAWNSSLYIGFILIGWITVQMYLIEEVVFLHVFYILLGLLIQIITLLPSVKNHYSDYDYRK
ncbi:hypothetical protein SAMN05421781_0352 [Marinococcus luteus]|uniref:Uncharacterized protein n=1 Tax=Marinococcus luteus TaxID=1122204 RepID=A0A1H2QKI5_9BACI|nr:hypothetical protein [Marinococcus luteus]SDW07410.1 hypothetical protein SAMN05421781_0352 [Marinococcus luteus]